MPAHRKPIVYVDVDDTLVRSVGSKRIPMTPVVAHVRALHDADYSLYCWSTGGAEYARDAAAELGLSDCFVGYLPKPEILSDDQHPQDWRSVRWVHPNEAASRKPEDYVAEPARE